MDTLQANFPQVVPLSLPEVREQHEQHRRQLTKSIYSTRNDRGRCTNRSAIDCERCLLTLASDWSNYAMVGGESVVRSKFASKCEVKFLRLILRELDRLATLVLLGYHSESLDIVRLGLEHVDEEIERLTAHNLFPTARIHQSFLKEVESRVRVMARYVDLWDEMESTWEHVEETGTQGSAIVPVDTTHWPDSLQWPVWCRNNAPHLSEQDLKDLEAPDDQVPVRLQDVDRDQILARVQYLPRGGRSILEHWRQDVTDMLAPILQVRHPMGTALAVFIIRAGLTSFRSSTMYRRHRNRR